MLYKKILLIDDDQDDNEVFVEAINSLENDILCYVETNPTKALEKLKSHEIVPEVIFLDLNMPVINGNEFIEKIREVEELQPIPIILYSSYSVEAAKQLFIKCAPEKYITKPHSFNELTSVLKTILNL